MPPAKRRLVPQPVLVITCPECGCKQNLPTRFLAHPGMPECRRCLAALTPAGATTPPDGTFARRA